MIPFPTPFSGTTRRTPSPDPLAQIRAEIANGLHTGQLRPGDRLASIRQTARQRGLDHRAVARAYRMLEGEGLVEVRGRSGVFIAAPRGEVARPVGPVADWMAGALADAWMRGITPGDVAHLARVCTQASQLRCVCVESNEDQIEAYTAEIQAGTGMTVVPVYVGPGDWGRGAGAAEELDRVREELSGADVVVTTQFQASAVRALLGECGPPLVVLQVNEELVEAVREHLRRAPLTIVAASAEFGARMRLMYRDDMPSPERIRLIVASDVHGLRALDPEEPILLTRAARRRLGDLPQPRLVFPHSPTLAPHTLRALAELAVRLCG